jgi:hypothetical protein
MVAFRIDRKRLKYERINKRVFGTGRAYS